jgi:hypothetical protein
MKEAYEIIQCGIKLVWKKKNTPSNSEFGFDINHKFTHGFDYHHRFSFLRIALPANSDSPHQRRSLLPLPPSSKTRVIVKSRKYSSPILAQSP